MLDIFDKCEKFTLADDIKHKGLYPYFHSLCSKQGPIVVMEGKEIIMLGSNNYLGLTSCPEVIEGARAALDRYGTGCSGSRYLNGNLDIHVQLEKEIAEYLNQEDAIIFSTGYGSNLSALSCLAGRNDYYIIDRESHASIYDGCKLSMAKMLRYKHSDMEDLERLLQTVPQDSGCLIATDGLFSMGGDWAKIPEIVELAEKYSARILIDDAHAFGVAGLGGRGSSWIFNMQDKVDLTTATFSKSLASLGGFVVGKRKVIDYIRHTSKPFIFTASPTPSASAAALTALRYLKTHPEIVDKVNSLAKYFREKLVSLGLKVKDGNSPIIPLPSRDTETTMIVNKMLFEEGVYVNCVFPPAVAENDCLIRTAVNAGFNRELLDIAADRIKKVFYSLGLC